MREREHTMLRSLLAGPRTELSFTHGSASDGCAPHVIESYIKHLLAAGFVEKHGRDSYALTEAGHVRLEAQAAMTPSRYYGNASMPSGSYRPGAWHVRDGADQHRQFSSKGTV